MNFLFPDHGVVFIHIPKNAGTSIRTAFGGSAVGPVGGKIPDEWRKHEKLTVVRHPIDRFLSAVNMFRAGAQNISRKDHYSEARLPQLTATQALDVLEDHSIGHDRSVREALHNLKHHLWPQTDPYNCLEQADHILRYETLEEDFANYCQVRGYDLELPDMRKSRGGSGKISVEALTAEDLARIYRIFRDDFDKLGYDPYDLDMCRGRASEDAALPGRNNKGLEELWPAYFSNSLSCDVSEACLPSPEVDLNLFAQDVLSGVAVPGWTQRRQDLIEHFKNLEPEFAGAPRLCHLLACTIVVLRRDRKDADAIALFYRIVREHAYLASHLNSRWLTSVCDTFVDISDNDLDRVLGLTGTLFSNSMKLIETELLLFYPPRAWPPKARLAKGGPLYDGMISFWIEKGDAIENLFGRVEAALSVEAAAAPFVREIVDRVIGSDTALSRIMSLSGQKNPPLIPKDKLRQLRRLMSDI